MSKQSDYKLAWYHQNKDTVSQRRKQKLLARGKSKICSQCKEILGVVAYFYTKYDVCRKCCTNNGIRVCAECIQEKKLDNDFSLQGGKRMHVCRECINVRRRAHYNNNKEECKARSRQWRHDNPEKALETYHASHNRNKQKRLEYAIAYKKNRMKTDPIFKLHYVIHNGIRKALMHGGITKAMKHLPYSISELKTHLELQFEYWMTWENWGVYNPATWDDNDSATWTWQLDHIMPCSKFTYTTTDCEEFRACWALSNLRPYSAKQNVRDGNRR